MSDRLWLSTRKGVFRLDRTAGAWKVGQVALLGHNVTLTFSDPRDGAIYCTLNLGHFGVKLHRSDDAGVTWTEIAVPAYPASDAPDAASLKLIWEIVAAGPAASDGLWVGTLPGGLFWSGDRGATWELNTALWEMPERSKWFGGGADHPGIHSICVDPRNADHVLVAVSCGGVWRTEDRGQSWTIGGTGMYAEFMPPEERFNPYIQDPHRMVRCAAEPDHLWVQHHNGIFYSTDNARTWTSREDWLPAKFGFAVAVHPQHPNIAWFVPGVKDETRIPVDARLVVMKTVDGGVTNDLLTQGLPAEDCYDLVYRHALDIDATGTRLAFGSTTGNAWVSENGGENWVELPMHFPPIHAVQFG